MANTASATLYLEVTYDPAITGDDAVAEELSNCLGRALSTPGVLAAQGEPDISEFFVMGPRQYAIYCMATREVMLETYGRFANRRLAEECIADADHRLADDLVVVTVLGVPETDRDETFEEEDN